MTEKFDSSTSSHIHVTCHLRHPLYQRIFFVIFLNISTIILGVYEHIRNVGSFTSDSQPYFEPRTERNVSVVVGQTSHLNCTVWDLGDRTVS